MSLILFFLVFLQSYTMIWANEATTAAAYTFELSSNHANVCPYTADVQKSKMYTRRVAVKTSVQVMCIRIPPVCRQYKLKYVTRSSRVYYTVTELRYRCCPGYKLSHDKIQCLPNCPRGCVHGTCTKPNDCTCDGDYFGPACNKTCSGDSWSSQCNKQCLCINGKCDPTTGECDCAPGYVGVHCHWECPRGFYGDLCAHKCSCNPGHTVKCDFRSGLCDCKPGYRGVRCELTCPEGHFGVNCVRKCPCRNPTRCHPVTGTCYNSRTDSVIDSYTTQADNTLIASTNGIFEDDSTADPNSDTQENSELFQPNAVASPTKTRIRPLVLIVLICATFTLCFLVAVIALFIYRRQRQKLTVPEPSVEYRPSASQAYLPMTFNNPSLDESARRRRSSAPHNGSHSPSQYISPSRRSSSKYTDNPSGHRHRRRHSEETRGATGAAALSITPYEEIPYDIPSQYSSRRHSSQGSSSQTYESLPSRSADSHGSSSRPSRSVSVTKSSRAHNDTNDNNDRVSASTKRSASSKH